MMQKIKKENQIQLIKSLSQTDLAYLAGIIDGEGCFFMGIYPRTNADGRIRNTYQTYIKISSCDYPLIDWIHLKTGSCYISQNRPAEKNPYNRINYSIQITGHSLEMLCEKLLPFLIIKKSQCEMMIKIRETFQDRFGSTKLPDELDQVRFNLMKSLRNLNSRFHGHPLKN